LQRRVAQVATFHAYAENPPAHVRLSRKLVGKLLYRNVRRGVAVSPGAAQLAQDSFGRPLHIIPNGVDHRLFCPQGPAPSQAGGPKPEQDRPFRLLFVGGFNHPRKGARYLLAALEALWAQGAPVTLDVVGGATEEAAQRLRQMAHVRHHRNVSTQELAALYRSCDALVAPATGQESFGIILLEAMATGKPIIATDIEGYRRVLDSGQKPGALVVPPKDAPALQGAIARLMAMPDGERAAMGAQNRRNVAPFTWDTVTQQLRALYLDAVAEAQAAP